MEGIRKYTKSKFTAPGQEQAAPSISSSVTQESHTGATASMYNSSNCEIDCNPCSTAGDYVMAVGYCSECKEYYCKSCYRAHSRSKATTDHTLLDQSTMPTIAITPAPASIASLSINKGSHDADDSQHQDEYNFNRDINIKYPNEKEVCFITCMTAISDNELVIIDQNNNSVKMIDINNDEMTGYIQFDNLPLSITTMPNREVAVTIDSEQLIRILMSTGGLSIKRSFKVNGLSTAIRCYADKLCVSYWNPVKFQIFSLSGGLKKTIKPDAQFLEQCTAPRYIAVHLTESKVYVSDWKNKVVLCMNMDGVLLHVYKDEELDTPHDISFSPSGSLYLCNRNQHLMYKLAEDLSEASIVLDSQDGLNNPEAMCFCPARKALYVSHAGDDPKFCNVIKEFKDK